jgi:PAS domain S-box-containing protein
MSTNPEIYPLSQSSEEKPLMDKNQQDGFSLYSKYNTLLQTIPDGLILISDSCIRYSNKVFVDMMEYRADEIINLNIEVLIAPNYKKLVLERYEKRLKGELVPPRYEIELVTKTGKIIPVLINTGLVSSGNEKLEFVLIKNLSEIVSKNIELKKRANEFENKLEAERKLLQYFIEYLPDSIYFKDTSSRFIKANKATLAKMGLMTFDELIGKTDKDFFDTYHAEQAKKDEEEIIRTGNSILNKVEKETWSDGSITWASTTKIPLRDDDNNIIGTFGITRDITELKKSEEIKNALLKISTAVTTVPDTQNLFSTIHQIIMDLMKADNFYIAMYNEETNIVSFPYFVDQVDQAPAERKAGRGLTEYVLRTGKAQLIDGETDLKLRAMGETSLIGEPTQIWLGVPLVVQGKTIGAIVVQDYTDKTTYAESEKQILTYVSEQVALAIDKKYREQKIIQYSEELKESNATKDKFFSIIAHDLKSPLNGLLGLSRMIWEEYDSMDDDELRSSLEILKNSTENVYKLIENLLDWSRFQTGKIKFQPSFQNMFTIVEDIRMLLNQNLIIKEIVIRNKLVPSTFIWGDSNMLRSLMQNLLSNAIKFSNKGGIIEITEQSFENKIEFTVADNGVGIEQKDLEKLFKLDVGFSTIGTMNERGTGLGLALCKEIIGMNGGSISVQSKINAGTKIIFTLNKQNS